MAWDDPREAKLQPSQLYGWRRQLRARPPGFAPVRIALEAASAVTTGAIEIEFATGARMRITGAVDRETVTAAIAALAAGRQR